WRGACARGVWAIPFQRARKSARNPLGGAAGACGAALCAPAAVKPLSSRASMSALVRLLFIAVLLSAACLVGLSTSGAGRRWLSLVLGPQRWPPYPKAVPHATPPVWA